ncbi:hypothetical protein AABB02_23560, partial [Streptomyces rimosus]|uniref:hypothetical protein n=1 Tax=Streptomyces rimosus TaxID=1927 RepID=UPI0031DB09DA
PVRFGLSASARFQPYQIRSAFPLSVSGSLLGGMAVRLSLFGLSDSIRSVFRSGLPVKEAGQFEFESDSPSEGVCSRLPA